MDNRIFIGSGHSDGNSNNADSLCEFYMIGCEEMVIDNCGPFYAAEDGQAFAELKEACGLGE